MAEGLDPSIFPQLIEYFPNYQVLYCHSCKSIYFLSQLDRHLLSKHEIEYKRRRPVIEYCQTLPVAVAASELALGRDHSLPVPFLPLLNGYACKLCSFYSTSRHVIRSHLNQTHTLRRDECTNQYIPVKLQSWYTAKRAKYWRVQTPTATATATPMITASRPTVTEAMADTLEQIEEQESLRLEQLAQDYLVADTEIEVEETSPWLNVTEWPRQFAGRPIELISRYALQPVAVAVAQEDTYLGSFQGIDLFRSSQDEVRLRQITWIFSQVFNRCLATLAETPYQIRCWLKSYNAHEFFPRPFSQTQKPATRKRYQWQWQRFLCFLFRAWRLPQATRNCIFGPALDLSVFEELLQQIWALLEKADTIPYSLPLLLPHPLPKDRRDHFIVEEEEGEEEEEEIMIETDMNPWHIPIGPLRDELIERVCELSCLALTTRFPGSDHCHYHSPLLYFVGVLGIHSYSLAYRTAYQFTPILAGLVWMSRLLLLEYTLPLAPYPTIPWIAGSSRSNSTAYFRKVHARFLCRDSATAIAHLFRLLAFGRKIAQKEGPRANISWSLNGQALTLFSGQGREGQWQGQWQQPIQLSSFREMSKSAIRHCHQFINEMMFGLQPAVKLNGLIDNLANRQVGYSYLSEPRNNLQSSFKVLLRQAWDHGLQRHNQWDHRHCHRYLRQFEQLQLQLLLCSHLTGGMPGRGSEISILKWQNTPQAIRNIFIYHNRIILIFEYNKTRTLTNNSFYVVRVLPPSVSRLWFLYLTYIRPFVDCLRHCHSLSLQAPDPQQLAYAFVTGHNQLYTTAQLSEAIRKLSLQVCSYPLTTGSYRQVIAAIAKRYVKELIATATAINNPAFQAIAHQFGHDPIALNNNYGLDLSYPEKLQPELIASYEQTSTCWHQWLQLADFEYELLRPPMAVAVAVAEVPEAMGGRQLLPKKRKSTGDPSMIRSTASQAQLKRARVELPDDIRQAMKRISDFYQSMA